MDPFPVNAEDWCLLLQLNVPNDAKLQIENDFFKFADGCISASYTDTMFALWDWLEEEGYGRKFEYKGWLASQSEKYGNDWPAWANKADRDMLDKFLFCLRRRERFHGNLWARSISDGLVLSLMRRIIALQ